MATKKLRQVAIENPSVDYIRPGKEKAFARLHKVLKTADANGNDDDVFNASKVKVAPRSRAAATPESSPKDGYGGTINNYDDLNTGRHEETVVEARKGWNVVHEPYSLEAGEVGKSKGVSHFERFSNKRKALSNLHQKIKAGKTPAGHHFVTSPKGEKMAYNAAKAHRVKAEETEQLDEWGNRKKRKLSSSETRAVFDKYNAAHQSETEAHGRTPEGAAETKARNDAVTASLRAKRLAKEDTIALIRHKFNAPEPINEGVPTRKHFQQVADIVKHIEDPSKRKEMAHHHASIFKLQNPRFDHKRFLKAANVDEDTKLLDETDRLWHLIEGRKAMPLHGHEYHYHSDEELHHIRKDAHRAAEAFKNSGATVPGTNQSTEGKYLDQVNDASTVLHYRSKGGKRLVRKKTDEETLDEISITKATNYINKSTGSLSSGRNVKNKVAGIARASGKVALAQGILTPSALKTKVKATNEELTEKAVQPFFPQISLKTLQGKNKKKKPSTKKEETQPEKRKSLEEAARQKLVKAFSK